MTDEIENYLRAHPVTAAAHGLLKDRLAEIHPNDRENATTSFPSSGLETRFSITNSFRSRSW